MIPTLLNKLKFKWHCSIRNHIPCYFYAKGKVIGMFCHGCNYGHLKQLIIKDCKCRFVRNKFKRCKFHKECIGDSCASGINKCDNPKH